MTRRQCIKRSAALLAWGLGAAVGAAAQAQTPPLRTKPVVLVVGDSLSAEYGLQRGSGWVALLEQRLAREKVDAAVVNASVSGDTTSGGRSRLPALLKQHQPSVVVIELGANDALRGLPLDMTERNLLAMGEAARAAGAQVLLLGLRLPPNYGRAYGEDFAGRYRRVADQLKAKLVPFFLKGVGDAEDPTPLFQADRIHPREAAQPIMLDNVWAMLRPMLKS
jgi:acyl-CoA thioesterase-1